MPLLLLLLLLLPLPLIVIDDSPAPTECDSDSSDDSDLPICVLPYKHWTNMKTRIRKCLVSSAGFSMSHELVFDLAAPDQDWQSHLNIVLSEGLSIRGVTHFKVGITYTPHKRFWDDDYRNLRRMTVALCTENCELTASAEETAIARLRSDPRCKNIAPGGESYSHGVSPHFLYIVFGSAIQFPSRRR